MHIPPAAVALLIVVLHGIYWHLATSRSIESVLTVVEIQHQGI